MNKMLGACLLVAGTTIGAGMLALPVVTGLAGFFPSLLLFLFFWVFMTYTAFLILEVNLWMGDEANMISMAKKTLGHWGEVVAWVAYLFLLYALTCAYLAGSAPLVIGFIKTWFGVELPEWLGFVPLFAIFGYFVMMGTKLVDYVNRLLMVGLGLAFVWILLLLFPQVNLGKLGHVDFSALSLAVPVVATSFGFHIVIPSLTTYLERDVGKIRAALWIGSTIPLIVYVLWEAAALGVIPLGNIEEAFSKGTNGAQLLTELLNKPFFNTLTRLFTFCAIVTSFLGVSMSLADCLSDGLRMRKIGHPSWVVDVLTFVPPMVFALIDPRAFLTALELAGAFGVTFLLAFMPALMVWSGRYRLHETGYRVRGGKAALVLVILFSLSIMGSELWNRL